MQIRILTGGFSAARCPGPLCEGDPEKGIRCGAGTLLARPAAGAESHSDRGAASHAAPTSEVETLSVRWSVAHGSGVETLSVRWHVCGPDAGILRDHVTRVCEDGGRDRVTARGTKGASSPKSTLGMIRCGSASHGECGPADRRTSLAAEASAIENRSPLLADPFRDPLVA